MDTAAKKNRAYQGDNVKQHYMCASENPFFVNSAKKNRAYCGGSKKNRRVLALYFWGHYLI